MFSFYVGSIGALTPCLFFKVSLRQRFVMATIEIFSNPVDYKYKSKVCSLSFLAVLIFIGLSLIAPFLLVQKAGGFLLKNRVYAETPDISFNYKYLLLASTAPNVDPVVCSTFRTYKSNEINDDCVLIKVREIDRNNDGRKDNLKFEAHFYTDKPIQSLKLLLFFNFHLGHFSDTSMESIALFTHTLKEEVTALQFYGDLVLSQKALLAAEGLHEKYNHSIEVLDYTLDELLVQNLNQKFAAEISNEYVTKRGRYSSNDAVVVKGDLIYRDHLVYHQASVWEELKWAWVQYLSCFLVFYYIAKQILIFFFANGYFNCYIIVPWK